MDYNDLCSQLNDLNKQVNDLSKRLDNLLDLCDGANNPNIQEQEPVVESSAFSKESSDFLPKSKIKVSYCSLVESSTSEENSDFLSKPKIKLSYCSDEPLFESSSLDKRDKGLSPERKR